MIPVTKTFFPPIEVYHNYLQQIWENQWLTNRGNLVVQLEEELKTFLGVPNITLTTNGTLPIQIALKILAGGGEVITTPFSYVATTSAIIWENCSPVFVDIHPEYLTIDESKIEQAITPKTTAILATHVFGNPCNIEEIENIAQKHNLRVIYDAAHCFDVKYKGKSIFLYGDVSTCSFHATKIFHTGEGGAIFASNSDLNHRLFYSHNFGHNGPTEFHGPGINAKMNELQGAMGLSVLPYFDSILAKRKEIIQKYNDFLDFRNLAKLNIRDGTEWNYSYYPIIFQDEKKLLNILKLLNKQNIFPRRYFYPSLNNLTYLEEETECVVSERVARNILCLPLFFELSDGEITAICDIINFNN